MTDILTTNEAAEMLQCQPKTVDDRLRAGDLPGVKFGVSWVIPREALLERVNELARQNLGVRPGTTAPVLSEPAVQLGRKRKEIPKLGP